MDVETSGPQSGYASGVEELTLLLRPPPRRERADAASNRIAVLDAAARLFSRHGVDEVSMDAIAAEAGVGKGTLFRRFGDKAGLAYALLDARERELQEGILSGPPPLGPGAAPAERLRAFVDAYFSYLIEHIDLVRMSEGASPGARYRIGAYQFWHRHTAILLRGAPDPDSLAHLLLAALAAEHIKAVLREHGAERTRAGLQEFARRLLPDADGTATP